MHVILGAITGIGGGMLRDVLVGETPAVLRGRRTGADRGGGSWSSATTWELARSPSRSSVPWPASGSGWRASASASGSRSRPT
ncbi:MAG: TRIC cation channel family protein [Actinobacteria bacterium]|nr:TRIC cation channel family protein [Actinomycetota bacterium]